MGLERLDARERLLLASERAGRPLMTSAVMLLAPPAGSSGRDFAERIARAWRETKPAGRFASRVSLAAASGPAWEPAPVDMQHQVRRVGLAAPGDTRALVDLVAHLALPLLDRGMPLWDAHLIDGLERDRVAILFRVHNALLDEAAALRLAFATFGTRADDAETRPPWHPAVARAAASRPREAEAASEAGIFGTLRGVAQSARPLSSQLGRWALDAAGITRSEHAWPLFSASDVGLGRTPVDAFARSFAKLDLSFAALRRVADEQRVKLNDVVLTLCDIGLRSYLKERAPARKLPLPLVATLSVSTRSRGEPGARGASSLLQVKLGDPAHSPIGRLRQIAKRTALSKQELRDMPPLAQQAWTRFSALCMSAAESAPLLRERLPASGHLLVSHLPADVDAPRFLGGGRLEDFFALPVLAPNHPIHVTLLRFPERVVLFVGAAHAVVADAWRLAEHFERAAAELMGAAGVRPEQRTQRGAPRARPHRTA
jgi:WS/DGAT/MGAT family acyltransferase